MSWVFVLRASVLLVVPPSSHISFPHPSPLLPLHSHYTSYGELRAHKLLERRPLNGPETLLAAPRTNNNDIGFEAHLAVPHKIHYVKQSDVSKYKSELIKAGVLY